MIEEQARGFVRQGFHVGLGSRKADGGNSSKTASGCGISRPHVCTKPQSTDLTVRGWGYAGFSVVREREGWFCAGCVRFDGCLLGLGECQTVQGVCGDALILGKGRLCVGLGGNLVGGQQSWGRERMFWRVVR